MRIHNDGIAPATAPPAAPAESVAQPGSSALSPTASNGSDQVHISSLSGNIARATGALAEQQAARVSGLAVIYSRGEYEADSMQVSRALVSGAMAGNSLEEDS
jgi:hypothetical protein